MVFHTFGESDLQVYLSPPLYIFRKVPFSGTMHYEANYPYFIRIGGDEL